MLNAELSSSSALRNSEFLIPNSALFNHGHRTNHQSRTAGSDDNASSGVADFTNRLDGGDNYCVYSDAVPNAGSDGSVNCPAVNDAHCSDCFNPLDCQFPAELFQRNSGQRVVSAASIPSVFPAAIALERQTRLFTRERTFRLADSPLMSSSAIFSLKKFLFPAYTS